MYENEEAVDDMVRDLNDQLSMAIKENRQLKQALKGITIGEFIEVCDGEVHCEVYFNQDQFETHKLESGKTKNAFEALRRKKQATRKKR